MNQHRLRYSEAIKQARARGEDSFQGWFDTSASVEQSILAGYWDLSFHILKAKVCEYLSNPQDKIALEIGYGGGRILNAACSYFKEVVGIDIHEEQETVEKFLRSQHKSNFKLIKTLGDKIEVDSGSVDFVYSFIVLQHLPIFDNFVGYIRETYHCLRPGGVAQLYFGRYSKLSPLDRVVNFPKGYKEIKNADVNCTSLVIKVGKVKKICRDNGFKILEVGPSYKGVPTGYPKRLGGQNYITLLKSF